MQTITENKLPSESTVVNFHVDYPRFRLLSSQGHCLKTGTRRTISEIWSQKAFVTYIVASHIDARDLQFITIMCTSNTKEDWRWIERKTRVMKAKPGRLGSQQCQPSSTAAAWSWYMHVAQCGVKWFVIFVQNMLYSDRPGSSIYAAWITADARLIPIRAP